MRIHATAVVLCAASTALATADTTPNELTPAHAAAGWRLLFDGATTDHWRAFRGTEFPQRGWSIDDGALKVSAGGGDIVTLEEFENFELSLEWKTAPRGNSGIMYRVAEIHGATWMTGPEYQLLDDHGHDMAPDHHWSAGAMYDLASPPADKVVHPAGEWNHARIRVEPGRIRHWLNGTKTADVRTDGPGWTERIAWSKFAGYSGFGVQPRGHIALQDHGDDVWFRNIMVRDLDVTPPGTVELFDGRSLDGWTHHLQGDADPSKTWSVRDGVLVCTGLPMGYLRTTETFDNYVLRLRWRFNPITGVAGNSGVLLRTVGDDKVWPKSVEAQLMSGRAGDFWNIGEFRMSTDAERTNGRNTRHRFAAEHPVGEWNEYEIIVDGGDVTLFVNGEKVNKAWNVDEVSGWIGLQSEGAEIHFRDITLTPIER